MKKLKYIILAFALFSAPAIGAITDPIPIVVRANVFSTSVDWESITGLRLSQFQIKFIPDAKLVGKGIELYFLDGFPCYGQTDRVLTWLGIGGKTDRNISLTCLYAPKNITLAWRDAPRDARQGVTTGILECSVQGDTETLTIDMKNCTKGKDWEEHR